MNNKDPKDIIPDKYLSPYNPADIEPKIYDKWQESGYFNPDKCVEDGKTDSEAESFSMVLPPPNVTGTLHTGHSMMIAIEDALVRYNRMLGKKTLWLPGTDHAAIATQSKVEKLLAKEGLKKHELGREGFLKHVKEFAQNSHDTIVSQIKKLGASLDWSREAYTLDEERETAVRTAFKEMYDAGLIYQGNRIINWDPKGQTTISDDEIVYEEEKTKFYYFKYGPFTIGTARPETKFGDKYVVMHPKDSRYKKYKHGEKIDLEWINGPITATIIKDESIDPEFGTGVMTITPWHSSIDFEIAERHGLEKEQIIDKYGKLLPTAGEFAEMKIREARPKIVDKLKNKGLLVKEEDYVHNVATAERTGALIEPQIMKQWFVNVDKEFKLPNSKITEIPASSTTTLKEIMKKTVLSGQIEVVPNRFEKIYFHWIDNLHDWCISRQIWFGHQIPVWYKDSQMYVGVKPPEGGGWEQDPDTLDTWFSSGLWTFSTLGWPKETYDLKAYHPTDVLETGYDILFFWVARMILMSGFLLGDVPFKKVYLHGLVRDEKGRKMSKSLGNIVDPVDLIEKYSADALRMALIVGVGPGNDSNLGDDKVKAHKHFSNKIWNITRFVLSNTEGVSSSKPELSNADKRRVEQLEKIAEEVTKDFESLNLHLASEKLYHYIWHEFADVILEESKQILSEGDSGEKASTQWTLMHILRTSIKLLHPFMPFITEEIWKDIKEPHENLLMVEKWPTKAREKTKN